MYSRDSNSLAAQTRQACVNLHDSVPGSLDLNDGFGSTTQDDVLSTQAQRALPNSQ